MRFLIVLVIFMLPLFVGATVCEGKAEDLKKAKSYRDNLKIISNTKSSFVGEDFINLTDYDGRTLRLSTVEAAATLSNKLRALINDCGVPPRELGFGLLKEEPVNRLEMRANRNLAKHRKEKLEKSHFYDSDVPKSVKEYSELEKRVGVRNNIVASEEAEIKTASDASISHSLESAQKLSSAEKCSSKDYSEELPPIRDQAGSSLCFAYTAADLLSFKSGQNISPLGVALAYKLEQKQKADFKVGGVTSDAANAAIKRGLCLDRQFGSTSRVQEFPGISSSMLEFKNAEFNILEEVEKISGDNSLDKDALLKKLNPSSSCNYFSTTFSAQFQGQNVRDLADVINKSTPKNTIFNVYETICASKKVAGLENTVLTETVFEPGSKDIINAIDDELDSGKILGIGYHSMNLYTPRAGTGGEHGSSIVGRRFNTKTGVCEYKLRNSWGRDCATYMQLRNGYDCKDGNVWLSADIVSKMTFQLSRFKKQEENN